MLACVDKHLLDSISAAAHLAGDRRYLHEVRPRADYVDYSKHCDCSKSKVAQMATRLVLLLLLWREMSSERGSRYGQAGSKQRDRSDLSPYVRSYNTGGFDVFYQASLFCHVWICERVVRFHFAQLAFDFQQQLARCCPLRCQFLVSFFEAVLVVEVRLHSVVEYQFLARAHLIG